MPRIALPKGRLLESSIEWLAARGFARPDTAGRALTLTIGRGWEAVLLKGSDVAVFVENGAADLGIVGSDVLAEDQPDIYDIAALPFGICRLSLAVPEGWNARAADGPLRVATKFPRQAERLLMSVGLWIHVIHVSSSAELAPALGLADVIVDIVDSGRTLRANGLREERQLAGVAAHLIANRRSYRFLEDRWWLGGGEA